MAGAWHAGGFRCACAVLLLLLTFIAHWPALDGAFLDFDDDTYVTDNPFVREGLSWKGLRWALTADHAANWHPLTWLAHQLDVELWGLDPRGHHLSGLLLHATNVLVLFAWLASTTGRIARSAWVAALFGLHPLRVESVAWIAERKDLLSGLCGLLSIWAYCSWTRRRGAARYLLAVLALAAGLAAKPMLVTLPFVFLLLDVWPLDRSCGAATEGRPRRPWLYKWPFFALAAASAAITVRVQRQAGAVSSIEAISLPDRFANAAVSYVRYLWKTIWPDDLALLYPHPALTGSGWRTGQVAGALLLLAAITLLAVRLRSRPYVRVGWLWFVGMLVPTLGLVQVGVQAMADRYTYLPSIGLAILAVWAAADLAHERRSRLAIGAVGGVVLILLVLATRAQARHWRDPMALYEHAIDASGGSPVLHNNLGAALERDGRTDDAEAQYRIAIERDPASPGAQLNLARLLLARGDAAGALEHARAAVALRPEWVEAHMVTGNALAVARRHREAAEAFRRAAQLGPHDAKIQFNLANALIAERRPEEAQAAYREALRLDPDFAPAHANLANLLLSRDAEAAESHFRAALRADPSLPEAWLGLGTALARLGRSTSAIDALQEASKLRPGWTAPLLAASWVLATDPQAGVRDGPRALRLAEQAAASGERDARLLDTLAAALAECGRFEEATSTAAEAIHLADLAGDRPLAARVRERLEGYRAGVAYRTAEINRAR